MVTRDFSGLEVAKVLVNTGNFTWVRTSGDHAILKWVHPDGPDVESRTVGVPLHDRVRIGTLRGIAEDAGAKDFDAFCEWIDRNRWASTIEHITESCHTSMFAGRENVSRSVARSGWSERARLIRVRIPVDALS